MKFIKITYWLIPLLWPFVSKAQLSYRPATLGVKMPSLELPLVKLENYGVNYRHMSSVDEVSGKVIAANEHLLSIEAISMPQRGNLPGCAQATGQLNQDTTNLSRTNVALLEKIEALTLHCIELEKDNQQRLETIQKEQDIEIQLQTEIRDLKQTLLQLD